MLFTVSQCSIVLTIISTIEYTISIKRVVKTNYMRKVTQEIVSAFMSGQSRTSGNSSTDGETLFLHGNAIAQHRPDGLYITNAGWSSNITKERLNGIPGVSISQKNFEWYLNGEQWDGSWKLVK